jgi:ClpP class serine protease
LPRSSGHALGCSAERLYVAPSGQVGSIGVVAVHCETSRADDAAGITYTVLRSGARKADLNPLEPLAAEASAKLQASMDRNRDKFATMVSRNRKGLSKAAVMATEGQWYDADEAVSLKLVDRVMVFDEVLQSLYDKVSGAPERTRTGPAPGADPDDGGFDGDEPTVDPAVAAYNAAFAEAQAEAAAVAQTCIDAGRSDLMIDFIERALTPAQAKAELATMSWDSAIASQQARTNAPLRK